MRKTIVYFLMGLLMMSVALAATVSRDVPSRVSPGEALTVKLNINAISTSDSVKTFSIEESLPEGLTISDWSISGVEEAKGDVDTKFSGTDYKFGFTPTGTSVTITYTTAAPADLGAYNFKATWFDLSGMSGADDGKSTVTVRTITCGDGVCEGDETSDNCEADCPKAVPIAPEEIAKEEPKAPMTAIIVIAAIVILGIIIFLATKKKKKEE